ncbi:MAG: lamin tail domain-containing protein [Archangium sp.]|nr:lamin tail domain-containing protein [Archangium sp.]MDP3157213.1 lamin tail domain-containing protein [Archangium sp.]MDP3576275.1 lamin tail domain-containing protein [Archangium sp.]
MMRLSQLSTLSLAALLAVAGCRQQQPTTVVPPAPSIEVFTVSAASLEAPGPVTLSWQTTSATRVTLTRAGQEPLGVPEDQLSGSLEVQVDRSTLFVMVARGEGGSEARALSVTVGQQDEALTLVALPAIVLGGATTTLAWTAPGAQAVTLTAGGAAIDTKGQITSGALVVRPDRDTVYTLSDGTRSATTSVTVQVALLSLTANPPAAQVGQNLTLSWTTAGADRVVIESPGRGQLAEITDATRLVSGSFVDVVPPLPVNGLLSYEVSAIKGTERMTRSLTVFVGSDLAIVRFDAPAVAKAGAQFFVRWTTVAADRVEVLVEGQSLYESPTRQLAAQGGFGFIAPTGDFEVELLAFNDRGDRISRSAQVDAVGTPTSATLTAGPTTVATGAPVTLTWAAAEARRVRITDSQNLAVFSVSGQAAEAGTTTVYPSSTTTYTLSADNRFGDPAVTATAAVTVTGAAPTVTQFPATAISGQLVELRPTTPGALLYGFPHQTVTGSTSSNFLDISATGERVLELGADVASVTPAFSTRLWGVQREGQLTISRAGWMAWGAPLVVNTSETALPSVSTPGGIIAPYWDDLRLVATSAVLFEVVGEAPEQRLIVQWDKLQMGTDVDSLATFQVQVHQAGLVSFHYQTIIPNASPFFTVGLQDHTRQIGFDLLAGVPPESNTALYFFSPLTVPPEARVLSGSSWGGFIKTGASYSFVGQPSVAVRLPFDIALSELMFRPAAGVTAGQYVEAVNLTNTAFDLSGWLLRSGDGSSFTLPAGTSLAANGVLVLGASIDPAQNDDAGVQVSWAGSGFSLGVDAGSLNIGTTDAGYGITFNGPADAGTGASVEIDPGPFVSTGASTPVFGSCWATASFGDQVPTQRGTPGRVPGCGFAYQRQGIPSRFHDIEATGTVLLSSTTNVLDNLSTATLAPLPSDPAPMIFGVRAPTLTVSSNGWFSPRTITTVTASNNSANKSAPTATEPVGTIAPFWEDLEALGNISTIRWQRIEPNEDPLTPARHWIIQWSRFTTDIASATPDDLNFQAKLFEDGTIEFHYATMRSGTVAQLGEGSSATVWIEEPTGTRALIVSANTRATRENTAVRFVAR